ncbi:unnamed protein product [Prunus armeniaca]|uniref:Ribosomal protein L34Ae n=1 Tax=Prunus armeniaca TaxID=36596 RepID=A0A6J5TLN2_PRUAR|nr:unnamed protein product [Prunus armeniaca]
MMVTNKFLVLKTQFDFIAQRLLSKSLYGNMVGVVGSMWVLCCSYLFFLFGFISRYILRFQADEQRNENRVPCLQRDDQVGSKGSLISDIDVFREEEECFQYSDSKSKDKNREEEETENIGFVETVSAASTDLYEFRSGKDINCYMEEPKSTSFVVQEFYVGWSNSNVYDSQILDKGPEAADEEKAEAKTENFDDQITTKAVDVQEETEDVDDQEETEAVDDQEETEDVHDQEKTEETTETIGNMEKTEDSASSVCVGEVLEKTVTGHNSSEIVEHSFDSFSFGKLFVSESELSRTVEYPENTSFGKHDPSDDVGSITYEFLVGRNVSEGLQPQSLVVIKEDSQNVQTNMEDFQLHDFSTPYGKRVVFSDQQQDSSESSDDEYIELSEPQIQSSSVLEEEVEDQHEDEDKLFQNEETKPRNCTEQSAEEIGSQEGKSGSNSKDENEDELPWEHEDIIEQLKMEMRNVRNRGLPTILEEETECTKMVENLNLKPLKIDEKFEYKDQMAELQKVYKSYAERMRKLDILNNQTMHAIGFLQLKDKVSKSITIQKSSSMPIVKSLLSQNMWRCKTQRQPTAHDRIPKFVGDLHKDLELVYVGQVCLSWEILHWQYGKAQELHAQRYNHQYNLVATEFQLFQVLLQRFIEDDPFQGPRVQHYVKNRCVLRSLLQVPSIRDDRMHDKKHGGRGEDDSIILSGMLVNIIEESMRIFWKFLRKDERNAILKGLQETQVDHKDLELLMDIRKDLQKKEKKLKDILRSGHCVVKKFQKQQEERLEQTLLIAQVDLRLISRVLNMSKLKTEQLVWCHEKLDKITFVHRKVHMEPSFLLFPC